MSTFRVATLVLVLGAGGAAHASAGPISFTDVFDPADVRFDGQSNASCVGDNATDTVTGQSNGACETLTWTHLLAGFNPATDVLSAASLTLTVSNDSGLNNQSDKFNIVLDLLPLNALAVPDSTVSTSISLSSANLATLLAQLGDGSLAATMTGANGNHSFYFAQSVLNAEGTRGEANALVPVPEPASLTLFATGLFGAAFIARRRRGSKAGLGRLIDGMTARPVVSQQQAPGA